MRLMILNSERPKDEFAAELKREFPGLTIAVEQITAGFRVTYEWGRRDRHSRPEVRSFIRGWRAATLHVGREPAETRVNRDELKDLSHDRELGRTNGSSSKQCGCEGMDACLALTKSQVAEVREHFVKGDSPGNRCDSCDKPARRGWWRRVSVEYDEWECLCSQCAYEWVHQWEDFDEHEYALSCGIDLTLDGLNQGRMTNDQ